MKKIEGVVRKVMGSYGITEQAEAAYICFLANQISEEKFSALSYKGGVLTISVKDSYRAQEIQFKEKKIISELNKKIGTSSVQRIRFKVC